MLLLGANSKSRTFYKLNGDSEMLATQKIFTAPLSKGLRNAACSVPIAKIKIKIKYAIKIYKHLIEISEENALPIAI